jgi:hypothetical protein
MCTSGLVYGNLQCAVQYTTEHIRGASCSGKAYMWAAKLLPFIPQPFDDKADDEASESQQYIATGQRIVDHALEELAAGNAVLHDFLNLTRYTPPGSQARGAALRLSGLHALATRHAAWWSTLSHALA